MTPPDLDDPAADSDLADAGRPSKTQLKKAMHELQDLGEALLRLPGDRVAALALPESLRSAMHEFKRTRSHEGKRRQMQYIGKLMRRIDPAPIREAVAAMRLGQARDVLALHQAEDWRARLLEHDDALDRWTAAFPASDLQHLRSLVRAARKDAAAVPEQRSGRAFRDLFHYIRQAQAGVSRAEAYMGTLDLLRIGIVSISDRASSGVYEDKGLPALQAWLSRAVRNPIAWEPRLIPDDEAGIAATLRELVDSACCDLVLTTGGTGPAPRDVTPEATLAVATKVLPGFGEQMRQIGLRFVPTSILSRQVAVVRGKALIVNLPGQPKSIAETLEGLPAAEPPVPGIFAAVPYCIDLIGGPYVETDAAVCKAFRPKSAQRSPAVG